jgi:hypothetical protein
MHGAGHGKVNFLFVISATDNTLIIGTRVGHSSAKERDG